MSDLRMDGIPLGVYLQDALTRYRQDGKTPSSEMFWASNERPWNDKVRDVLQIEFSGERLVNHISFQVARFPHSVKAEFWDPLTDNWVPLREQIADIRPIDPAYDISVQRSKWEGDPVEFVITDSNPAQINASSQARSLGLNHHPQHFGSAHWVEVKWRNVPVLTRAIRLILVRRHGFYPTNAQGVHIPYSLAVKNFSAGYRVYSLTDVPASARSTMGDFSTSTTYLGARLNYRLKEHHAHHVIEGEDGLHWKSEPQPVNYSVVNFFLDVRDANGRGQNIDRLYIDPLTVGPTMNVYYTNDDPDSDFVADDTALTFPLSQTHGEELLREMNPLVDTPQGIIFPDANGYGQLDNAYLQWEHNERPWTLGVSLRARDLDGVHPIFAWSGNTLRIRDRKVEFVASSGTAFHVDIPEHYQNGSEFNIALAHIPRDDLKYGPPEQRFGVPWARDPRFGDRGSGFGAPGTPDNPWEGEEPHIRLPQPLPMTAPNPRFGTTADLDPEFSPESRFSSPGGPEGYITYPGSRFGSPGVPDPNPAPELGSGHIGVAPPVLHEEEEMMRLSPGTLTLKIGTGQDPALQAEGTISIPTSERIMGERPEAMFVGAYSSPGHPGTPNFVLRGLTMVIDRMPTKGWIDGFINEPSLFIIKTDNRVTDLTLNSLFRLHPAFSSDSNPLGAVGGPGHRYNDVEWTPVSRDYTLRQGYVRFPTVRAKHFKLEFTNLVMQTYENLVPIRRKVKLFPTDLVRRQGRDIISDNNRGYRNPVEPRSPMASEVRHYEYTDVAPGVQTMMDLVGVNNYGWAVTQLRLMAEHTRRESKTEGYVAEDPTSAEVLRKTGWVWSYSPWHVGSSSPKWDRQQVHRYEEIEVNHESRVGFFVGLRRVMPVRVDYLTDDDTEVYEESFLDDAHIEDLVSVEYTEEGISAVSNSSMVTSKTFPSVRQVRGLQFATIQSDIHPLLSDDGFISEDLAEHWKSYGDATIRRVPLRGAVVKRGWSPRTYVDIENHEGTYARMDEGTYADLESKNHNGLIGGGLDSEAVEASDSGRIYAAARVSAVSDLSGPVRLEIVSVNHGVLAADERTLSAGEKAVLKIGYQVGSAHEPTTYAELEERTYASLESETYGDLQTDPIGGPVFLRLYQANPSSDEFVIERMSLFDAPVVWQFSVDDGDSWHDALDIRNNPRGVLTFPEPGKSLKWRAKIFHVDAEISHLVIRPWYGGLLGIVDRSADDYIGPNRSVIDDYPDVEDDPMWARHDPIPEWWYHRDVASRYGGTPNVLRPGDLILPEGSFSADRLTALIAAVEAQGGRVWRQDSAPPAGQTHSDGTPDDRALDLWLNTRTGVPYMWDSNTKEWVLA